MNKTMKNVLLIFTLVCIIILIVFSIELFVLNRGNNDNENSGAALPEGTQINTGESEDRPPAASTVDILSSGQTEQDQISTRPKGKRYELPYSATEVLVLYVDEELFEHIEMDSGDMFVYLGNLDDADDSDDSDDLDGSDASLEICPAYIPDGAEACAESYLDAYLEGNESFVSGISQIKQSDLSGVFVIGVKEGETFEAWIHDPSDGVGDNGIAFVIRYSDGDQKNALYAILDTLILIEN